MRPSLKKYSLKICNNTKVFIAQSPSSIRRRLVCYQKVATSFALWRGSATSADKVQVCCLMMSAEQTALSNDQIIKVSTSKRRLMCLAGLCEAKALHCFKCAGLILLDLYYSSSKSSRTTSAVSTFRGKRFSAGISSRGCLPRRSRSI